jgi:hypothetical protein
MNWNNIWNHIKPKADKRYVNESQLLWAVVDGTTGDLDRGNGVTYTNRSDTGDYQVRFEKNVRGCVYVASVGLPGSLGVELPGPLRGRARAAGGSTGTTSPVELHRRRGGGLRAPAAREGRRRTPRTGD